MVPDPTIHGIRREHRIMTAIAGFTWANPRREHATRDELPFVGQLIRDFIFTRIKKRALKECLDPQVEKITASGVLRIKC